MQIQSYQIMRKNILGNICHHDQISFLFLMEHIPLTSFSLTTGEKFDQNSTRNFETTLSQLIGVFHNTLGKSEYL